MSSVSIESVTALVVAVGGVVASVVTLVKYLRHVNDPNAHEAGQTDGKDTGTKSG